MTLVTLMHLYTAGAAGYKCMLSTEPFHARVRRRAWLRVALLPILAAAGCYDSGELLKQAQSAVLSASLVEVDLGEFVTTLPRDEESGHFTMINLRVYGTVKRPHLSAVEKQQKGDNFKLRHAILAAVRKSTRDELADPNLAVLRARILKAVNQVFADAPVKEVGFYQLTVR